MTAERWVEVLSSSTWSKVSTWKTAGRHFAFSCKHLCPTRKRHEEKYYQSRQVTFSSASCNPASHSWHLGTHQAFGNKTARQVTFIGPIQRQYVYLEFVMSLNAFVSTPFLTPTSSPDDIYWDWLASSTLVSQLNWRQWASSQQQPHAL